jgi:hypothetical protein
MRPMLCAFSTDTNPPVVSSFIAVTMVMQTIGHGHNEASCHNAVYSQQTALYHFRWLACRTWHSVSLDTRDHIREDGKIILKCILKLGSTEEDWIQLLPLLDNAMTRQVTYETGNFLVCRGFCQLPKLQACSAKLVDLLCTLSAVWCGWGHLMLLVTSQHAAVWTPCWT